MNELKATAGPWSVDADEYNSSSRQLVGIYVSQDGDGRICKAFANCLVTTEEELRANAALIAAAWDMYQEHKLRHEALRQMLGGAASDEFKRLDALLKKARGE
jgi:hypothetical protein